ncbi:MAG: hypothetical protein WCD81_10410 [Candidatus Bathyarchaeia archaeon]
MSTNQEPVFLKARKGMIPRSCFVVFSIGKHCSDEEISKLMKKLNMWASRGDKLWFDIKKSGKYSQIRTVDTGKYLRARAICQVTHTDMVMNQVVWNEGELYVINATLLSKVDQRKLRKTSEEEAKKLQGAQET